MQTTGQLQKITQRNTQNPTTCPEYPQMMFPHSPNTNKQSYTQTNTHQYISSCCPYAQAEKHFPRLPLGRYNDPKFVAEQPQPLYFPVLQIKITHPNSLKMHTSYAIQIPTQPSTLPQKHIHIHQVVTQKPSTHTFEYKYHLPTNPISTYTNPK